MDKFKLSLLLLSLLVPLRLATALGPGGVYSYGTPFSPFGGSYNNGGGYGAYGGAPYNNGYAGGYTGGGYNNSYAGSYNSYGGAAYNNGYAGGYNNSYGAPYGGAVPFSGGVGGYRAPVPYGGALGGSPYGLIGAGPITPYLGILTGFSNSLSSSFASYSQLSASLGALTPPPGANNVNTVAISPPYTQASFAGGSDPGAFLNAINPTLQTGIVPTQNPNSYGSYLAPVGATTTGPTAYTSYLAINNQPNKIETVATPYSTGGSSLSGSGLAAPK